MRRLPAQSPAWIATSAMSTRLTRSINCAWSRLSEMRCRRDRELEHGLAFTEARRINEMRYRLDLALQDIDAKKMSTAFFAPDGEKPCIGKLKTRRIRFAPK